MAFDFLQTVKKQSLPAGRILVEAGKKVNHLIVLHKGSLWASKPKQKEQKLRLYQLPGVSSPGLSALVQDRESPISYVTAAPSSVSVFPAVSSKLRDMIKGKLDLAFLMAQSLLNETYKSYQIIHKLAFLSMYIRKVTDNMSLAYKCCMPSLFTTDKIAKQHGFDPVMLSARACVAAFESSGGQYPESFQSTWLQTDKSQLLHTDYHFHSQFDHTAFQLYRRMLALPMALQSSIYKTDMAILDSLIVRLARFVDQNLSEIHTLDQIIEIGLADLLEGEYSYMKKFYDLYTSGADIKQKEIHAIVVFFYRSLQLILREYQNLRQGSYDYGQALLKKLGLSIASQKASSVALQDQKEEATKAGPDGSAIRNHLQNSPTRILSLLDIGAREGKILLESLKQLKSFDTPIDSNPEARRLRKRFAEMYWQVWAKAYSLAQAQQAKHAKLDLMLALMLRFAFFDEEMLDDTHLAFLYTHLNENSDSSYPILHIKEWLAKVQNGEEEPSINDLGQLYLEQLKKENPDAQWRRLPDVPLDYNTPQKRITNEITQFVAPNVRLTSGSAMSFLPILNRYQLILPIAKAYVSPSLLAQKIQEILSIDYTAFYREILVNDEEKSILKEFVRQEVAPYFILLPSCGTKIMMWQELAGRNKSSRGRIAVPMFATADLFTILLQAVAAFRWELSKTILGADWNNVGQASLTAEYTDYVQFYKKNRNLSSETKEQLSSTFKRFRFDRERFANDYVSWIKYESQGILKVNKVVRSILYRHVPFSKDIRRKMGKMPAFTELENRFRNLQLKQLKSLEIRYRKYGDALPDLLKKHMSLYETS